MNRIKASIFFIIIFNLSGCSTSTHYKESAALWQQHAGELRGLYYQAFTMAKMQLDAKLEFYKKSKDPRPLAIIADIDETILDNSPFLAWQIINQASYPKGWNKWVLSEQSAPLPGAVDFMNYAYQKGVTLFYISNRKEGEFNATLNNLTKFNFPIDKKNLMLLGKDNDKNKKIRREKVLRNFDVALYLGDNLNDFSEIFDQQNYSNRKHLTDAYKENFGTKFIIFPNPMYGDWESGIHHYQMNKDEDELALERRSRLMPR